MSNKRPPKTDAATSTWRCTACRTATVTLQCWAEKGEQNEGDCPTCARETTWVCTRTTR
jgi:hypothetical protein